MRLNVYETVITNIANFAGGNPGAIQALVGLAEVTESEEYVKYLMILDKLELYEDKIYMLWNDSCNRDIEKFSEILNNCDNGVITEKDIEERIKRVGRGKSFDDLLRKSEDLPRCSICGKGYAGYGNNAEPVNNGRCCDNCNTYIVIPRRITDSKWKEKK